MSLDGENVPRQDPSWLRWASLLAVGIAAIVWAGIAVLNATGSLSFTGWESIVGDKEAGKAENLSQAFRTAAKRALPAAVVIETANNRQMTGGANNGARFSGPSFEDSAGEEDFDWQHAQSEPEPGLGSGVVIDAKGIVLTNSRVV